MAGAPRPAPPDSFLHVRACLHSVAPSAAAAVRDDDDGFRGLTDNRYFSAIEAAWRIFDFESSFRSPAVVRLALHLPGQQIVVFTDTDDLAAKAQAASKTTLTEFFRLCGSDAAARRLLYYEVPEHYTWDASERVCSPSPSGASPGLPTRCRPPHAAHLLGDAKIAPLTSRVFDCRCGRKGRRPAGAAPSAVCTQRTRQRASASTCGCC